jgi:hypothetical protein
MIEIISIGTCSMGSPISDNDGVCPYYVKFDNEVNNTRITKVNFFLYFGSVIVNCRI